VNLNVNFNILKQFNCALVGLIKDLITSRYTVQLWKKKLYQCFLSYVFFRTTEWISVKFGPGFVLNMLDRCNFNLY
jgi:hypothetical protein